MIDPETKDEIMRRLRASEEEHDMKILYACESGSRAWGFPSPDSDYDVRFFYVRRQDWYLSFDVERKRDVIEYPIVDEIDCNGWDLRKTLYLFTRTNGALLEWLNSPIRYIEEGNAAEDLRALASESLNKIALSYHYGHMARRVAREYLKKDEVKLKKYFYILRPLFALRYIEQDLGVPPVEFQKLVDAVSPDHLKPAIAELLETKRVTPELGVGKRVQIIDEFIDAETDRHGETFKGEGRPDMIDKAGLREKLNEIFRAAVK